MSGPPKAPLRPTRCWREQDSNHRSRVTRPIFQCRLWLVPRQPKSRSERRTDTRSLGPSPAEPMVRILFPPAVSPLRTAFLAPTQAVELHLEQPSGAASTNGRQRAPSRGDAGWTPGHRGGRGDESRRASDRVHCPSNRGAKEIGAGSHSRGVIDVAKFTRRIE